MDSCHLHDLFIISFGIHSQQCSMIIPGYDEGITVDIWGAWFRGLVVYGRLHARQYFDPTILYIRIYQFIKVHS